MSNEKETLTITLTARAPVEIRKEAWPIVASASEHDGKVECQANGTWRLNVRRHKDGRAIIYGVHTPSWQSESDRRGGRIVAADADIPAEIKAVAAYLEFPERLADECIADLPAEPLD